MAYPQGLVAAMGGGGGLGVPGTGGGAHLGTKVFATDAHSLSPQDSSSFRCCWVYERFSAVPLHCCCALAKVVSAVFCGACSRRSRLPTFTRLMPRARLALALAARRHASRQTLEYTLLLMLMWPWQPALLPCSYDSTTLAALPTTPTVTTLLNFAAAPPPQHPQASHHTGLLVYLGPNTAWPCGVHVRLGCVWCSCTGMKSASLDDHFGAPFHRLVSQTLTHGCIQ